MTYKEELTAIAKEYCKNEGVTFLFVNETDSTFGYETKNGNFIHKSFWELADELGVEYDRI